MFVILNTDLGLVAGCRYDWDNLTRGGKLNPDVITFGTAEEAFRFAYEGCKEPGVRVVRVSPRNRLLLAGGRRN